METEKIDPYLKGLLDTLADYNKLLSLLQQREQVFNTCRSQLNSWDYNEALIILAKNKVEINVLKDVIREKEEYFKKYAPEFNERIKKMEAGFEALVSRAKYLSQSDQSLKSILDKVKWDVVATDTEVKVHLYENLVNLIQ